MLPERMAAGTKVAVPIPKDLASLPLYALTDRSISRVDKPFSVSDFCRRLTVCCKLSLTSCPEASLVTFCFKAEVKVFLSTALAVVVAAVFAVKYPAAAATDVPAVGMASKLAPTVITPSTKRGAICSKTCCPKPAS